MRAVKSIGKTTGFSVDNELGPLTLSFLPVNLQPDEAETKVLPFQTRDSKQGLFRV